MYFLIQIAALILGNLLDLLLGKWLNFPGVTFSVSEFMIVVYGHEIESSAGERLLCGESFSTNVNGNGVGISSMLVWAKQSGVIRELKSYTSGRLRGTSVSLNIPI